MHFYIYATKLCSADTSAGRRNALQSRAFDVPIFGQTYRPAEHDSWILGQSDRTWDVSYQRGVTHISNRTCPSVKASDPLCVQSTPDLPFADSILLNVVHLNVYRAYLTNKSLFMRVDERHHECKSTGVSLSHPPTALPPQLLPTALQCRVPHSNWIDYIPLPALRDNLIKAAGTFDEFELGMDFMGAIFQIYSSGNEICGFIAWSEPWEIKGWEVSEGFVKKWGRLLVGCQDLIYASNSWRLMRDEKPLQLS